MLLWGFGVISFIRAGLIKHHCLILLVSYLSCQQRPLKVSMTEPEEEDGIKGKHYKRKHTYNLNLDSYKVMFWRIFKVSAGTEAQITFCPSFIQRTCKQNVWSKETARHFWAYKWFQQNTCLSAPLKLTYTLSVQQAHLSRYTTQSTWSLS